MPFLDDLDLLPPPLPPPYPGRPSLTPFLPCANVLFTGLLGSHPGGSLLAPADVFFPVPIPNAGPFRAPAVADASFVAFAPLPPRPPRPPDPIGPAEPPLGEFGDDEIAGGFALSVSVVPSSNRSSACWTPSPPTSRPPPHVPDSWPPRRASLSTSSMWMIPILRVSAEAVHGCQQALTLSARHRIRRPAVSAGHIALHPRQRLPGEHSAQTLVVRYSHPAWVYDVASHELGRVS